jgi:AcrR family transcriptional regulator
MQVLDEQKREKILTVAAKLFAAQPFHKVLLSDVAETAGVGKGTVYLYFKNKHDLYISVLYCGFSQLLDRLRERIDESRDSPRDSLETVIREIVHFAYQNPNLFELMRNIPGWELGHRDQWDRKRGDLSNLIEAIIRRGIALGTFEDPHPELTARLIPGLVRSALIEKTPLVDRQTLIEHILRLTRAALAPKEDSR